jgi:AraC family transcriptional regulator, regulatory protein of adaptative response / DNA-3-methyladenine glycosylase II
MNEENNRFYKALSSRDARFDGVFFIGVTSTGIYCRPICPAKLPKKENCRFFKTAEAAEKEFYRPCLRCRPELAPGHAPVDNAHRIANALISRLEEGLYDDETGLEQIAAQFGLSSRQIRRIVQKEFGVSPIELILTRRLLLAKQLLTDTDLSIIDIAFASGFSSLRRFNDAFKKRYRMPPSRLRKEKSPSHSSAEKISLQLNYRPPFDWIGILNFLAKRSLLGIEYVEENAYLRTVKIGKHQGWIRVSNVPEKNAVLVDIALSLTPVLSTLLGKIRNMFDLNARPDIIALQLSQDPLLADDVLKNPGLRVPGTFDGFELAVRAILGQQITVKAATILASRFVKAFGEIIATPYENLHYLCPTPQRIAAAQLEEIASLGIIRNRAQSIIDLAKEISSNRLNLETSSDPESTINQLISIRGIGNWTAHYIAMRALRWPDAFPKEDIALRKKLGGVTAKQAEELSQTWRPWRSYALLHLWQKPIN